jgi:hypothetical protein
MHEPHPPAISFLRKLALALVLIVLGDALFFFRSAGSTVGVFALAWAAGLICTIPAIRRERSALVALAAAGLFGMALIDHPSLPGGMGFWVALSSATFLARRRFDDAAQHLLRVLVHGATGFLLPIRDALHLRRVPAAGRRWSVGETALTLALPLVGSAIFIALFASANPLIEAVIGGVRLPSLGEHPILHITFWVGALALVWPSLRPAARIIRFQVPTGPERCVLPGITVSSVTISLLLFNGLFAVQNLLDILFLWSGAPLPEGMTAAEYTHRGAYPLIVTALLAGAFVMLVTRPGTNTAARPLIRRLVALWTAQNLILVASSIVRTVDYVEAYMLTTLRLAALAWMLLVGLGLLLIFWRMLKGRSLAWLINTNACAAALVIASATVVDLAAVAAAWNVDHAREVGGAGQPLDLCYLNRLGTSALVPLTELEARKLPPAFADRVAYVRSEAFAKVEASQREPYGWTWRDARRLATARSLLAERPRIPVHARFGRGCDGTIALPRTSAPSAPAIYPSATREQPRSAPPLTKAPAR